MKLERLLRDANQLSRERILQIIPNRVDTCLPSCLMIHEVLKAYGIGHEFLPVRCEIRNLYVGQDYEPWGIGIDRHLVVVVGNMILDPSLDQASRPKYGMNFGPMLFRQDRDWIKDEHGLRVYHSGCEIKYLQEDPWHLTAPDYTTPIVRDLIRRDADFIVKKLRGRMQVSFSFVSS